jgi:hypothetical protein
MLNPASQSLNATIPRDIQFAVGQLDTEIRLRVNDSFASYDANGSISGIKDQFFVSSPD